MLCGTGAVTAFALRRRTPARVIVPAALLLALGTAVTLVGAAARVGRRRRRRDARRGRRVRVGGLRHVRHAGRARPPARARRCCSRPRTRSPTWPSACPPWWPGRPRPRSGWRVTAEVYGVAVAVVALTAAVLGRVVADPDAGARRHLNRAPGRRSVAGQRPMERPAVRRRHRHRTRAGNATDRATRDHSPPISASDATSSWRARSRHGYGAPRRSGSPVRDRRNCSPAFGEDQSWLDDTANPRTPAVSSPAPAR